MTRLPGHLAASHKSQGKSARISLKPALEKAKYNACILIQAMEVSATSVISTPDSTKRYRAQIPHPHIEKNK